MKQAELMSNELDELLPATTEGSELARHHGNAKMARAEEVAHRTQQELSVICEGLSNKMTELGMTIVKANEYIGVRENVLHFLGKVGIAGAEHEAEQAKMERLRALDTVSGVREIANYVKGALTEIESSEREYIKDINDLHVKLDQVIAKQAAAMPLYLKARDDRTHLETVCSAMEDTLKAIDEGQRPAKEREFENLRRELSNAKLAESDYMPIVQRTSEAIPVLQRNRDAAQASVESLHLMRRSLLEKFLAFKIVLEQATTALRARARIEMYANVDPAFNKAIELITENNVATAGAAMSVAIERVQKAALDPAKANALLQELLGNMLDYSEKIAEIEEKTAKGPREFITDESGQPETLNDLGLKQIEAISIERKRDE